VNAHGEERATEMLWGESAKESGECVQNTDCDRLDFDFSSTHLNREVGGKNSVHLTSDLFLL
jgi:hypothetical protein